METFDVIIIGGGPAGAMAGIELQRRGFKTCIIDKAAFPRDKLCGGGLTFKTMELLAGYCPEINPKEYVTGQTCYVDFYHKTTWLSHTPISKPCYFTDRKLLDTSLTNFFKAKGGTLVENTRVNAGDIRFDTNTISVNGSDFQYKYLIGANGCSTLFTKPLGVVRNDFFCMETRIPKEVSDEQPCRIYFGVIKIGYGWYFPKNDHDVLGIGGKNVDKQLPKQAEQFFKEATPLPYLPAKGAFIPSGKKINALSVNHNTLLVGDAAGFIDPVTGEGLYYALLSGIYAAESIEDSVKNRGNLTTIYAKKCRPIKENMKWGFRYVKFLNSKKVMPHFIRALQIHPHFVSYYLEEVMCTYHQNYKTFVWHYFTKDKWKK